MPKIFKFTSIKKCNICNDTKPICDFTKHKDNAYAFACKNCMRTYSRLQYWKNKGHAIQHCEYKICNYCDENKSSEKFSINNASKDGRNSTCRDCFKIRNNNKRQKLLLIETVICQKCEQYVWIIDLWHKTELTQICKKCILN
jgi:hypothetical protein